MGHGIITGPVHLTEPVPLELFDRTRRRKHWFHRTNTSVLMAKHFDPIRWIVEDYLPEGFSVLAGRQKLGKTWLAIDISLALACGGAARAMPRRFE